MNKEESKSQAKIAFDENESLAKRYHALQIVHRDVLFRLQKLQEMSDRLDETAKNIQKKALEQFKNRLQIEFMKKYKEEIKTKRFTPDVFKEFEKLQQMEKQGCYHFKGIEVYKEDCSLCRRHCRVKEF